MHARVDLLPEFWENVSRLNPLFTFASFVEGKSNQLARAAASQVGDNPGKSYNPLFIYGGVGLGKTHLMHAIGNAMLEADPGARVSYVHSERFVSHMIKALQHNTIDAFKQHYRTAGALDLPVLWHCGPVDIEPLRSITTVTSRLTSGTPLSSVADDVAGSPARSRK